MDDYGDIYILEDGNGQLVLSFDTIYEQSRMDPARPHSPVHDYIKAMLLVLTFCQPRSVIILGLGGGSLLRALHRLDPALSILTVELREMVAAVANRYFSLPKADRVHVECAEAGEYIHDCADAISDIVFADMYEAHDMHPVQKQIPFLADCIRVLSPEGWLVLNFHKVPNDDSAFMIFLKQHFPTVLVCVVEEGNHVILARKITLKGKLSDYRHKINLLEVTLDAPLMALFYRLSLWREKPIFMRKSVRKKLFHPVSRE